MVSKNEHQMITTNEKEVNRIGSSGLEMQDDTIIYVMHGYLNRVRVQYKNNRNIMNNLD